MTSSDDRAIDALDRRALRLCLREGLPPDEVALRLGRTTQDVERLLVGVVRGLRMGAEEATPADPTHAVATG